MYKNSFVHYLTKVLVDILLYSGIVVCGALPFFMPKVIGYFDYRESVRVPFTVILLLSGLCALYILWQLKAMFATILGGNPFVSKNVTCLRKCAVASLLIALIFFAKSVYWFSFMSAVGVIIFFLLGLFCLTLKDIFKQAVAYKEENDWTV